MPRTWIISLNKEPAGLKRLLKVWFRLLDNYFACVQIFLQIVKYLFKLFVQNWVLLLQQTTKKHIPCRPVVTVEIWSLIFSCIHEPLLKFRGLMDTPIVLSCLVFVLFLLKPDLWARWWVYLKSYLAAQIDEQISTFTKSVRFESFLSSRCSWLGSPWRSDGGRGTDTRAATPTTQLGGKSSGGRAPIIWTHNPRSKNAQPE